RWPWSWDPPLEYAGRRRAHRDFEIGRFDGRFGSRRSFATLGRAGCEQGGVMERSATAPSTDRRHADARAGTDGGKSFHVTERAGEDVAGARKPRLGTLRDRRAAVANGDRGSVRPIGDLARRDNSARILLSPGIDRDVEI